MKAEKIEDAHNFKRMIKQDFRLTQNTVDEIHDRYVGFINENYFPKTYTHSTDHIINKPTNDTHS